MQTVLCVVGGLVVFFLGLFAVARSDHQSNRRMINAGLLVMMGGAALMIIAQAK